jgi:two-component system, OmpR family, phosphate regulon sensor histidine kinase PhoR
MSWLFARSIAGVVALCLGGAAGYAAGNAAGAPWIGLLSGSVLAVAAVGLFDALRAARLVEWLRSAQSEPAPRDTGFWGEIGYRIERALRLRELRQAQEATRLAQFLAAIEASPNGVLLLDAADRIDWCNSVAADHFGLDPQRDRRQHVTNLLRAPAFVTYLQAGRYGTAVAMPSPDGRRALSVLIRPYGEAMKLVLSQDVTERERAETMRRDFVANVSHEIRTPLTVLAGFIENLGNLPLSEVERRRVLHLMAQQTQRMQTLVADLLTLAQIEGSPRPPADRWLPLARLLDAVEADARALSAGRHAIAFAPVDGVQLAGAEAELQSAIGNLLGNAVRYTPESGRIEVTWLQHANGSGEIAVRDSGVGIAREHLPRLAERFYRVDSSRSRDTGGTGLGLAIVKHVAQRHGGELDVQSEPGRGSTFRLLLPAARVRVTAAPPAAAPAGMRALITPSADNPS